MHATQPVHVVAFAISTQRTPPHKAPQDPPPPPHRHRRLRPRRGEQPDVVRGSRPAVDAAAPPRRVGEPPQRGHLAACGDTTTVPVTAAVEPTMVTSRQTLSAARPSRGSGGLLTPRPRHADRPGGRAPTGTGGATDRCRGCGQRSPADAPIVVAPAAATPVVGLCPSNNADRRRRRTHRRQSRARRQCQAPLPTAAEQLRPLSVGAAGGTDAAAAHPRAGRRP